jgi:hypothetical protein
MNKSLVTTQEFFVIYKICLDVIMSKKYTQELCILIVLEKFLVLNGL